MKRCLSVLLCALLLLPLVLPAVRLPAAHAATMAELEDEVKKIENEIRTNKEKLEEFADKKESQQAYLDTLNQQIEAVEKKADTLDKQIQSLDEEIVGYDNQLKRGEACQPADQGDPAIDRRQQTVPAAEAAFQLYDRQRDHAEDFDGRRFAGQLFDPAGNDAPDQRKRKKGDRRFQSADHSAAPGARNA